MSDIDNITKAIQKIQEICKSSKTGSIAYEDGEQGYKDSLRHFLDSSSKSSSIAVQPGSEEDLAAILKVIAKLRVPFAVKGGGHSMVPEFSSTTGIHIAMVRFSEVAYNEEDETLSIGAGCLWDIVYKKVAKHGRNIVGGSATQGVGVAGWLLGGGYSLKSNKYGLGIDNVTKYRIILPSGEITEATATENSDLFHALRGGGNNFGIVTQFTVKTHPQGPSYGASVMIGRKDSERAKLAILDFVDNERRREAIIVAAFRHILVLGKARPAFNISVMCVYDGKKPPLEKDDPFKKFREIVKDSWKDSDNPAGWGAVKERMAMAMLSIDNGLNQINEEYGDYGFLEISSNSIEEVLHHPYDLVPYTEDDDADEPEAPAFSMAMPTYSLVAAQSDYIDAATPVLSNMVANDMANLGELNARGRFGCIMVSKYTKKLINAVEKEAAAAAKYLAQKSGEMVLIDVWPQHPNVFENSPPGAAWPHEKDQPCGPLLAYFRWKNVQDDPFWLGQMKKALDNIYKVALAEGCTSEELPIYSNTSLEDVPVERIYRDNLGRLNELRTKYDPEDVMTLSGGFKIRFPMI